MLIFLDLGGFRTNEALQSIPQNRPFTCGESLEPFLSINDLSFGLAFVELDVISNDDVRLVSSDDSGEGPILPQRGLAWFFGGGTDHAIF